VSELIAERLVDAEIADERTETGETAIAGQARVGTPDVDIAGVSAANPAEASVPISALASERISTHLLGARRECLRLHRNEHRCSRRAFFSSYFRDHRRHDHASSYTGRAKPRLMTADQLARDMFFIKGTKTLITRWNKNDFGNWSWNLKKNGRRTPYFIHTTPADEASTVAGKSFEMIQSHGCVHIRPRDRDEMMADGVLKAGVEVEIMPYGRVGPPR